MHLYWIGYLSWHSRISIECVKMDWCIHQTWTLTAAARLVIAWRKEARLPAELTDTWQGWEIYCLLWSFLYPSMSSSYWNLNKKAAMSCRLLTYDWQVAYLCSTTISRISPSHFLTLFRVTETVFSSPSILSLREHCLVKPLITYCPPPPFFPLMSVS